MLVYAVYFAYTFFYWDFIVVKSSGLYVMHMVSIELLYIYIFYKGVCSVCWCMQYHLAGKKCDTVLLFLGRLEKGTPAYTAYTLCNTVFLRGQGRANQTGTRGNRVRFSQFTVKPWESKKKIETFVKSDVAYLQKTRENQKSVGRGAGRGLWLQKLCIKNVMVVSWKHVTFQKGFTFISFRPAPYQNP